MPIELLLIRPRQYVSGLTLAPQAAKSGDLLALLEQARLVGSLAAGGGGPGAGAALDKALQVMRGLTCVCDCVCVCARACAC